MNAPLLALAQQNQEAQLAAFRNFQETPFPLLQIDPSQVHQEINALRSSLQESQLDVQALILEKLDRLDAKLDRILQEAQAQASIVARLDRLDAQLGRIENYGYASARRVVVPCGRGEVMVRTAVGYMLCSATDHALISSLVETGELESGTRLLIQRVMKPGGTFVDAGANMGMHTVAAAIAMGGRGRIVAFEPFPATCDLLKKSLWMNGYSGMAEVHQAAVSNREGTHSLFLGATSGHHSLFELEASILPAPGSISVPLVRLDNVVGPDSSVDMIKIDVEGAELDVLESARPIIQGNPNIALVVEFGASHLLRMGRSTATWLQPFTDLGLDYRAIDAASGDLLDWSMADLESVPSVNLLFARPESGVWALARRTP